VDESSAIVIEPGRYPFQRQLLLRAGDRTEAEKSYRTALQEHKAGRVLAAIDAYQQAVQSDPSYFEAYHNLGFLAFQSGNVPLSLHAYERALTVQPTSTPTRYNFALALQNAQYFQDAAFELEKVIATSPQDTRTHLALANLYAQQLRQPLLARQHYERVLAIEPQHPQAPAIRRWLVANP
jgi:Tfp pilus assembly protein PilF